MKMQNNADSLLSSNNSLFLKVLRMTVNWLHFISWLKNINFHFCYAQSL